MATLPKTLINRPISNRRGCYTSRQNSGDSYPIHRHRCLLDVGGGEGVFLAAVATRAPALRLMLLDLPAVAERARTRLAAAGLLEPWRQFPDGPIAGRSGCY